MSGNYVPCGPRVAVSFLVVMGPVRMVSKLSKDKLSVVLFRHERVHAGTNVAAGKTFHSSSFQDESSLGVT